MTIENFIAMFILGLGKDKAEQLKQMTDDERNKLFKFSMEFLSEYQKLRANETK